MKPILILTLTCVPLAGLTAWSFVELIAMRDPPPLPAPAVSAEEEADAVREARARARVEQPVAKELAEADLFSPDPIPLLENPPKGSSLAPLGDTWPQWLRARRMVSKVLEAEQSATGTDLEQLKDAVRQMTALKEKYEGSPPRGSHDLLQILDRRHNSLKLTIARRELEAEAATVLARARTALDRRQFDECVSLCDQLLTKYSDAVDVSVLAKIRVLQVRARFWGDAERMPALLEAAETPAKQVTLLRGFLDKYPDRQERTPQELSVLERYQKQLRGVEEQTTADEHTKAGLAEIERLRQQLPAELPDRLARAVEILDRYPADAVREKLLAECRGWLGEFLREKRIDESPMLREVETKRGEIIRGFLKEVKTADGTILGYKRYPTYEQYLRPVSEVGTYRKDELSRSPGESVPRLCVTRYNEARKRLVDRPQRREAWTQMAELCQSLQAEWRAYRAKPGSSSDELAFDQEEQFARQMIGLSVWEVLAKLYGS